MRKYGLQRKIWGSLLAASVFIGTVFAPAAASAADSKFVDSIWKRYTNIEKAEEKLYLETLKHRTLEFKTLLQSATEQQKELERIIAEDQKYLENLYEEDLEQLERTYGDNRDYRAKLADYRRQLSPSYTPGVMWDYYKAANKSYTSSAHWKFDKAVSPSYSMGVMWKYRNEVNPYYSTSTMWKYRNTVNPHYSTSTMWKLRNEANENYSAGTMWRYAKGKITKAAAQKQMDQIFRDAQASLQQFRSDTKRKLDNVRDSSVRQLTEIRDSMIVTILEKRENAITKLNEMRQSSFGGTLTVRPLEIKFPPLSARVPAPNEIKVYIDGELQSFEQPPVVINGNTLVPMRAIFERLGAKITWNSATQTVTAVKNGTQIVLKLKSKKALVGGAEVELSVPAQAIRQTTMVPLRFVSEALGAEVKWNAAERTVTIRTDQ
ncbi:hypothetical protein PACILC2_33520 [Paenibacillus cisolokensis]|jgi:Copper amine oxidase N-terminal domain.|uniref:Copper amine oxidase-like N-terminal domain-containing protein n=1 Tax=Paenibacillus cisolokensis TaxID=1658519 RepID=A0ABQ4N973_9BACL|nr:copper amine oxidase N-terminal domain-containing protein [Paenibacillus cisolokensis]GIQ64784.1 hypothetical protein PACILC2_33520 [Paenibacillus cisolokensis]